MSSKDMYITIHILPNEKFHVNIFYEGINYYIRDTYLNLLCDNVKKFIDIQEKKQTQNMNIYIDTTGVGMYMIDTLINMGVENIKPLKYQQQ